MPRVILISLFSLALITLGSCAQHEAWGTKWDTVIGQPGVSVSFEKDLNNDDIRIIELPSGIRVIETHKDGKITSVATDNSGYGAILCNWEIYVTMRNLLDVCYPQQYATRKKELDTNIDRINNFIVANSMEPLTKELIELAAKKRIPNEKSCNETEAKNMLHKYIVISKEDLMHGTDILLSVPRPPVFDPCF
jgi:hypothetical protein